MASSQQRRVVTGVDDNGKSVFLADDQVDITTISNFPPNTGGFLLWGSNTEPVVPAKDATYDYDVMFPPREGFRFEIFNVMPDEWRATLDPLPPEQLAAELDEKMPGLREHMEPDGMHATASVDLGVVLNGEIWLELDNGEERLLQTGDVFVQTGTRHAWRNKTNNIVSMAVVLIGARVSG